MRVGSGVILFQLAGFLTSALADFYFAKHTSKGNYSKSPVPWCSNDMVSNESGIRDGLMACETDTVEELTGRKPVNPKDLLEKYSFVWKENVKAYRDLNRQ